MNKKDIKYIKQLADRLPPVYEQTVSGYYEEDGKLMPNIVNHEINHVRRMRKAYESLGLEGIKSYLDMIHQLQIKRNDLFRQEAERQKVSMDVSNEGDLNRPVPSGDQPNDTNGSVQGELGGARKKVRKNRKDPKPDVEKA